MEASLLAGLKLRALRERVQRGVVSEWRAVVVRKGGEGERSLCQRQGPPGVNPSRITFSDFSRFPTSTQYFLFEFHETRLHLQDLLLEITVRRVGVRGFRQRRGDAEAPGLTPPFPRLSIRRPSPLWPPG